MSTAELQNWIALYVGTALLASIAGWVAFVTVAMEFTRERGWREVDSARSAMLLLPRLWWRWQQRYLLGTPVILAIVGWVAASMNWSR